jgi:hypothetical protein
MPRETARFLEDCMARSTLGWMVTFGYSVALGLGAAACAHPLEEGTETVIQGQYEGQGGSTGAVTSGADSTTTTTGSVGPDPTSGAGGAVSTVATTTTSTTTVASSTTSGQGSVTSGGPSTGSGGTCDASGDCGTCGNCAVVSLCAAAADGCTSNQSCLGLLDCLNTCADQACADACVNGNPSGLQLYMAVTTCVLCDACPVDCDGPSSGACAP